MRKRKGKGGVQRGREEKYYYYYNLFTYCVHHGKTIFMFWIQI